MYTKISYLEIFISALSDSLWFRNFLELAALASFSTSTHFPLWKKNIYDERERATTGRRLLRYRPVAILSFIVYPFIYCILVVTIKFLQSTCGKLTGHVSNRQILLYVKRLLLIQAFAIFKVYTLTWRFN